MALVKCGECGQAVSTQAKVCPACGAKPRKRTRLLVWMIAGLMMLGFIQSITTSNDAQEARIASEAAMTPEQRKARDLAARQAAARVSSALALMGYIKTAAREPDSVVFEALKSDQDGARVCAIYRGRNGFGGMTAGHAVAESGVVYTDVKNWNQRCTKAPMVDMTGEALARWP